MLWLAAFPVATLVFVYAMVRSTVLTLVRGGVVWRGTFYSLRELREHLGPLSLVRGAEDAEVVIAAE